MTGLVDSKTALANVLRAARYMATGRTPPLAHDWFAVSLKVYDRALALEQQGIDPTVPSRMPLVVKEAAPRE